MTNNNILNNYSNQVNLNNLENNTFKEIVIHSNYCYFVSENEQVYYINPGDFKIQDYCINNCNSVRYKKVKEIINSKLEVKLIMQTEEEDYYIKYIPIINNPSKFPKIERE